MNAEIAEIYGKRLRVRACGLLYADEAILLVNHQKLSAGDFWAPPGGGIEFREPIEHALKREFLEETGLMIEVGQFAFGCEFIKDPLHAIELFFWVTAAGGSLTSGVDPEIQILRESKFMGIEQLSSLRDDLVHGIFRTARSKQELKQLTGFYRI